MNFNHKLFYFLTIVTFCINNTSVFEPLAIRSPLENEFLTILEELLPEQTLDDLKKFDFKESKKEIGHDKIKKLNDFMNKFHKELVQADFSSSTIKKITKTLDNITTTIIFLTNTIKLIDRIKNDETALKTLKKQVQLQFNEENFVRLIDIQKTEETKSKAKKFVGMAIEKNKKRIELLENTTFFWSIVAAKISSFDTVLENLIEELNNKKRAL